MIPWETRSCEGVVKLNQGDVAPVTAQLATSNAALVNSGICTCDNLWGTEVQAASRGSRAQTEGPDRLMLLFLPT